MPDIKKIKLGETTYDIVDGVHKNIIELLDNGTTTAGTWLAKTDRISAYEDGQLFLYKVTVAGGSTTTLNINGLGAKTVYRAGTNKATTQYAVGQYILLAYNSTAGGFNIINDADANSYAYVRQYQHGDNAAGTTGKYPLLARYNVTNKNGTYDTAYARYHTKAYVDTSTGEIYSGGNKVLTSYTDTNQKVKAGSVTFGTNDEIDIVAGSNVTVTGDATNKKITISATDTNTHNSHAVISGVKADGSTQIKGSASSGDITLGDSGVTAGEYGPTSNQTPAYGATFNVPDIKVNSKGIVTSVVNRTVKIPASDNSETTLTITDKSNTDTTDLVYAVTNLVESGTKGHTVTPTYTGLPTKTYVDTQIANLVNSAPEALDTLGELAAALEDHEDAYDALLETIGGKSNIGHTHSVSTKNAAPAGHTHTVTVSGTTANNTGNGVTVATGVIGSTGTGGTVVTGSSGTATVLKGVKASGTDTFVKAITAGSGSLTSVTTQGTGDIKYVESISNTAASASGTAKAGSETHTHTYIKPTGVSLGSNTTSTNGVKYVEAVTHTAATLGGTTTFNTDAIKSVSLSASDTSTDGPAYVASISGSAPSLTGTTKFVTGVTTGSGSLTSVSTQGTGDIKYIESCGTFSQGTLPSLTITSKSPSKISSWSAGSVPSLTITSKSPSKISAWSAGTMFSTSVSNGVLTLTAGTAPSLTYATESVGSASGWNAGSAPSLSYATESVGSASGWSTGTLPSMGSCTTKYLHHTHTSASSSGTGTVGIQNGSYTATTKYMKPTGTAASTASVTISGGSITPTTKYFHPSITTESVASGTPSATTTFVTGVSGGTTTATTKYLHHTHVVPEVSSAADAVTAVAADGTATAVTGLSTGKLVTTTAAPNAHNHTYGSSTALTTTANSGDAVVAVTEVKASTN